MVTYVKDLIKSTFRVIGVLAKSEEPADDEYSDTLQALNFMLNSWSVRSLMILGSVLEGFPLVSGIRSYTIGIGKTFDTIKPTKIDFAFIRDLVNNSDTPLAVSEFSIYNSYEDKLTSRGTPRMIAYDPGLTRQLVDAGTIFAYPVPNGACTLFIGEQKPIVEFATIEELVSIQPAYYELIKYQLAIRIYREYHEHGRPIPEDIVSIARTAMETIQTMNSKQVLASMDFPDTSPSFNINTGDS